MTAVSGAPVAGGGGAPSTVLVIATHTLLSGGGALAGLARPRIVVDGHEHSGRWGRNELPVTPGQHQVQVWVPYPLPRRGPADAQVTVPPGGTVELEYRVPLWPFLHGSLGPPPQHHRGAWITLLILGGAAVALCAAMAWLGTTGG